MSVFVNSCLMATSSTTTNDGAASIGPCKNAEQFALKRLGDAEEPKRPSQLAEEYGCSNSRMRDALGNLRDTGAVTRVARGEYAATGGYQQGENAEESLDGDGGESAGNDNNEVTESGLSEYASDSRDSGGDGGKGDLEEMVRRQRELFGRSGEQSGEQPGGQPGEEIEAEVSGNGIPIPVRAETLAIGAAVLLAVIVVVQVVRAAGNQESEQWDEDRDIEDVIGV